MMGSLVETALFDQWLHLPDVRLHYLGSCEIDLVHFDPQLRPLWGVEVKWSDRFEEDPTQLGSVLSFCKQHAPCEVMVTTRTKTSTKTVGNITINFKPASLYSFLVGYNLTQTGSWQALRTMMAQEARQEQDAVAR
jgi:hypothetical protein